LIPTPATKLVPILASAACGLQFTGPDTNTDPNLSAPVTVSWEHNVAGADASWTVSDLSWRGDFVRGSTFFVHAPGEHQRLDRWDSTNGTQPQFERRWLRGPASSRRTKSSTSRPSFTHQMHLGVVLLWLRMGVWWRVPRTQRAHRRASSSFLSLRPLYSFRART
ncbi:hypothetical protein CSHISOI_11512, partial [Colletotrichum shisoi]